MTDFSTLFFKQDLIDLAVAGVYYTWSNGRAWSRLDRFIVFLGRHTYLTYAKNASPSFAQTTFHSYWTARAYMRSEDTLNLKICG